jgi:tetratricopeptide (TPR) repeat protein
MKQPIILAFLLFAALFFTSCKGGKSSAATKPTKENKSKESKALNEARDIQFQKHFFEGITQKSLGNNLKAKASFLESLSIDPNNAAAHYEIARLEYESGNIPNAQLEARKAVELEPDNLWYNKILADISFDVANFTEAAKYYGKAIEIDDSDVDSYFQQVMCLMQIDRSSEAIAVLNKLEKKIGVNEQVSLQKHQIYVQENKLEQATDELKKLSNSFPEDPRFAGMLGQFYQQTGKTLEAQNIYRSLETKFPEDGLIQLMLADYYLMSGDDNRSYESLKKAFRSQDVNIDQKVGILLNIFEQSHSDAKAAQRTNELVAILEEVHPEEAKTWAIGGDVLYVNNKPKEARPKYRRAVELDPSRNLIWQQLVQIDSEIGDYIALEQDTREALIMFPTITEFYLYQGIALIQLKRHSEALEPLNLGKELVIDNPALSTQFYSLLGDAYHATKQYEQSDEAYEKALFYDPNNVFVLNNYSYYLSLRKTKLEKALEYGSKANELSPDSANFQDTYAWVFFTMGRYNEAKEWLEKALNNGGDSNGVILEHYGDVWFKLGNTTEALKYWKEALEKGGASKMIQRKIDEKKYIESNE